jgi:hypothetical protein
MPNLDDIQIDAESSHEGLKATCEHMARELVEGMRTGKLSLNCVLLS